MLNKNVVIFYIMLKKELNNDLPVTPPNINQLLERAKLFINSVSVKGLKKTKKKQRKKTKKKNKKKKTKKKTKEEKKKKK